MSSYIYFSVKYGDNRPVPLFAQSRNSSIYQSFYNSSYLEYGELKELNKDVLDIINDDIKISIKNMEESKKIDLAFMDFIRTLDKPIDEIEEEWYKITNSIKEDDEYIDELKHAKSFIDVLYYILDEFAYEKDDAKKTHILFGIDSGFDNKDEK